MPDQPKHARLRQGVATRSCETIYVARSGRHTDNRPIASLFPVIANLRDDLAARYGYVRPIRLGLAGGLGAPSAIAAAFQQGAAYVMTGSINQSAIEAGVSSVARALLAQAEIADVTMAPAADMFELGVKVQVLKRGTMFATRGQKLYELYRRYDSLEALPDKERRWLETQVLRESVSDAWSNCRDYLRRAHPTQMARAEHDAKLRMALVLRRYLFLGAEWARDGADDRRIDYQIWCGPAMGAFTFRFAFLGHPPRDHRHRRSTDSRVRTLRTCARRVGPCRSRRGNRADHGQDVRLRHKSRCHPRAGGATGGEVPQAILYGSEP